MNYKSILSGAIVLLAFSSGLVIRGCFSSNNAKVESANVNSGQEMYTCSMHPQIRLPDPNAKCPLCGMDLIPVSSAKGNEELGPRELRLSPRAQKLAEVESAEVVRRFVDAEIRMVGKVEYDETRLSYITAWVPGRLDRLYVDYTGVKVNEGDHLADLYSPELLSAQEELLQAVKTSADLQKSSSDYLRKQSRISVESAKEKLRLWGISDEQIESILQKGAPSDQITLNSTISGVVVHKNALEGMYVQTGTQIYTIADLSTVWVKLDAYESDLPWIHYGQHVEFRTEAYPGEVFTGQIAFIDPTLNAKTRTVKIRVNLPNPEGKLKPEMFVRATVHSQVAQGGKVMDPKFSGKWISPMHPEIIKDSPGECDICGMDLVSAESLGYVRADTEQAPLVIPASAPLITGTRAVVYVEKEVGIYEGREIELGPRAGSTYLVKSGLKEGERVVVNGAFKIDSAIQILAKPSMMNPEGGGQSPGRQHGSGKDSTSAEKQDHSDHEDHFTGTTKPSLQAPVEFHRQLDAVVSEYMKLQKALSQDQLAEANQVGDLLNKAIQNVGMGALGTDAHEVWMRAHSEIQRATERLGTSQSLKTARTEFEIISNSLIGVLQQFGSSSEKPLLIYHCPMAFQGKGADWIQENKGVENPYYGSRMFTCGNLKETIEAGQEGHQHE